MTVFFKRLGNKAKATVQAVQLNNFSTSLRLEALFWELVREIAGREDKTLGRLLSEWHDEYLDDEPDEMTFAAFVRVRCMLVVCDLKLSF